MEIEKACELDKKGWIPGPHENEETYEARVSFGIDLKQNLSEELKSITCATAFVDPKDARALADHWYSINLKWVPVVVSSHQLWPWQGAAAWIFQLKDDSPISSLVQIREGLFRSKRYLGIYPSTEIIAHELCHAARMAFEEPKYEELLASRLLSSPLQRKMRGLLASKGEIRGFTYLLVTLLLFDAMALAMGAFDGYWDWFYLKAFPLLWLVIGYFRSSRTLQRVEQLKSKLDKLFPGKGNYLLFRLTDQEIDQFMEWTPQKILEYADKEPSWRWQVLRGSLSIAIDQIHKQYILV